jgi:hypothetical protein
MGRIADMIRTKRDIKLAEDEANAKSASRRSDDEDDL